MKRGTPLSAPIVAEMPRDMSKSRTLGASRAARGMVVLTTWEVYEGRCARDVQISGGI